MGLKFRQRVVVISTLFVLGCLVFLFHWSQRVDQAFHPETTILRDSPCVPYTEAKVDYTTSGLLRESPGPVSLQEEPFETFRAQLKVQKMPSNKGKPLKVFVIPHSHNDPAWLKNFVEYYEMQTSKILENMLNYLTRFPDLKFIWVESIFLERWWRDLKEKQRNMVRILFKKGRVELVGGGWVSPDEATTHIHALVDQMITGHDWVKANLGVDPDTWWNLDPFGYSAVVAYLVEKAGYSNTVILRLNSYIKLNMWSKKSLEFHWKPFWQREKKSSSLFTSVLPFKLYSIKHSCGPNPHVCLSYDFRQIPGEDSESLAVPVTDRNRRHLAENLYMQLEQKSRLFRHNVIMFPVGDDFRFDRVIEWEQQYFNYKKLFDYMNKQRDWNIDISFGTPRDYFRELEIQSRTENITYPSLSGDFFTYIDAQNSYWSGYYTTRPHLKRFVRDLQSHIRAAEIFVSFALLKDRSALLETAQASKSRPRLQVHLDEARRVLAFLQHHDAITGTSMDPVMNEYYKQLWLAITASRAALEQGLKAMIPSLGSLSWLCTRKAPRYLTESQPLTLAHPQHLLLVNSISQERVECPRVLTRVKDVAVKMSKKPISCQVNPAFEVGRISDAVFEVVFCLKLKPFSVTSVSIMKSQTGCTSAKIRYSDTHSSEVWNIQGMPKDDIQLENSRLEARFSSKTGMVTYLRRKDTPIAMSCHAVFQLYDGGGGGVYIFSPANNETFSNFYPRSSVLVVSGPLMSSVRVIQSAYNHTATVYHTDSDYLDSRLHLKNEVDLGTHRYDYRHNEIILRLSTNITSGDHFYTDSNGFVLVRRQRLAKLPLAGNYYPITSAVVIESSEARLNLLTNHAHGVTSLVSGQLEVMLQRFADADDHRGNPEGVIDDPPAESEMALLLEKVYPTRTTIPDSSIKKQSGDSPEESDMSSHFEKVQSPGSTSDTRTPKQTGGYLSLDASLTARFLNYPPLMASVTGTKEVDDFHLINSTLPCELEVVTMRSSAQLDSVLVVLQRHARNCSLAVPRSCHSRQMMDGLTFESLFPLLSKSGVLEIDETTLGGLRTLKTVPKEGRINLGVPDLKTFRVKLNT